jgi:hypothetical protein
MKDLSQYPTPETDAVYPPEIIDREFEEQGRNWGWGTLHDMREKSRDLERRLTACREFIRNAIDFSHIQETDKQSAEDLLAATAPKP